MRTLCFIFLAVFVFELEAQSGVSFHDNKFELALELAKEQGKDVFVDTYAPWCVPCKKMDKVFSNSKVGRYYNDNFINVKVNVDALKGKAIASKYNIVFLPTMLIIDSNGNVKHRIDGVHSAKELLQIGEFAVNPQNYKAVQSFPIEREVTDIGESNSLEVSDIQEEKILFVLDDPKMKDNPEYLYHEAFFRLKEMDGSHKKIAQKYLDTQDDWSSETNRSFIVNFMDNANSEMFNYFASERDSFEVLMGAQEYRKTLEILINANLYRQIPRPNFERVNYLFGLLYPRKAEKYSYNYMLQRLEDEERYAEFVSLGETFLATQIKQDADLLHKLGKYECLDADKFELKECIYRVEQSIKLSPEPQSDQFFTLAKLYQRSDKKKKALEFAEQAKAISAEDSSIRLQIIDFILATAEL